MKKYLLFVNLLILSVLTGIFSFVFAQGVDPIGRHSDGISVGTNCLTGMGQNCFYYEAVIGIADGQITDYTATSIAEDVIFGATYMVGTVLAIVLVYCGLGYIFAARGGNDTSKFKKGLINAMIGSLLVWGSYAIVRLIQYMAKG